MKLHLTFKHLTNTLELTCLQVLPASDEMNIATLLYDSSEPIFPEKKGNVKH